MSDIPCGSLIAVVLNLTKKSIEEYKRNLSNKIWRLWLPRSK